MLLEGHEGIEFGPLISRGRGGKESIEVIQDRTFSTEFPFGQALREGWEGWRGRKVRSGLRTVCGSRELLFFQSRPGTSCDDIEQASCQRLSRAMRQERAQEARKSWRIAVPQDNIWTRRIFTKFLEILFIVLFRVRFRCIRIEVKTLCCYYAGKGKSCKVVSTTLNSEQQLWLSTIPVTIIIACFGFVG